MERPSSFAFLINSSLFMMLSFFVCVKWCDIVAEILGLGKSIFIPSISLGISSKLFPMW